MKILLMVLILTISTLSCGKDGSNGTNGSNGSNGVPGAIGPIGPTGPQGPSTDSVTTVTFCLKQHSKNHSIIPGIGLKINNKIYIVSNQEKKTGLTELVPGSYSKEDTGLGCDFKILEGGLIED